MNLPQMPHYCKTDVIGSLSFFNSDNIEIMKGFADNEFDLAIVDPPYAVGASDGTFGNKGIYTQRGKKMEHYANHDKCPEKEYFEELFRVSKNQIIWGSNYYPQFLYHSGAIIWDKKLTGSPMSDCEIAFQSFNKLVKKCTSEWNGFLKGNDKSEKIHPNQKPIHLYDWTIKNYAKEGDKILDTHLGSGSIAIAIEKANRMDKMNLQFVGIELHDGYYEKAINRIRQFTLQGTMSF
jgi:site-specific DNA-methyltransferase (adenine-specific)